MKLADLVDHIAEAERIRAALHDANARITQALRDRTVVDPAQRYTRAYDIAVGAIDDAIQTLRVLIAHMEESAPVASIAMAPAPRYQIRRVDHGYMVVDTSLQPGLDEFGTFESESEAKDRMDELNRLRLPRGEEES